MSNKNKAVLILVAAIGVGAVAQSVAKKEAAFLGMTTLELAFLGGAIGAVVLRVSK
jgi:hypothetical protein